MIGIRRVEIGEAPLQEMIGHPAYLIQIYVLPVTVNYGQPHQPKAQSFCSVRKKCHGESPFVR